MEDSGPLAQFPSLHSINHATPQLGPGHNTGNATWAPSLKEMLGMPMHEGWVRNHTDFFDSAAQNANGHYTWHYAMITDSEWVEGDTIPGMPTWRCGPESLVGLNYQITPFRSFSWPMLNYMLSTKSWSVQFGDHDNINEFLAHWRMGGVQQRVIVEPENSSQRCENNLVIKGKARMPAVTYALNQSEIGTATAGMSIYALYVRFKHDGMAALSPAAFNAPIEPMTEYYSNIRLLRGVDGYDEVDTRDAEWDQVMSNEPLKLAPGFEQLVGHTFRSETTAANNLMPPFDQTLKAELKGLGRELAVLQANDKQPVVTSVTLPKKPISGSHYWQVIPWISATGEDPPAQLWSSSDPNDHWTGAFEYIGNIVNILSVGNPSVSGSQMTSNNLQQVASRSLFPKQRGTSYIPDYCSLPCFELHYRARDGHTLG